MSADWAPDDGPPPDEPRFEAQLPDFWRQRPELTTIHQFARSRRAAPWAVLGCVLTRVVAYVEPNVVLPPLIGGEASLNLFLGLVGESGGGKQVAEAAAKDLLAIPMALSLTECGVGSGEGIAHTYMRHVPGSKGEKPSVEQHTTRALFRASEVDTLGALSSRQGSTLLPRLRDAWMGDNLGFAYADVTRRLDLRAHTYRLCLIAGVQPGRAGTLLDDKDGGTPQRFVWLPVVDPTTPDERAAEPERLQWGPPPQPVNNGFGHARMTVCATAADAIDSAALDRARGNTDALDGHALLCRLKVAAAFALLQRRNGVEDEDWTLAGTVMRVSDGTRGRVVEKLHDQKHRTNKARGRLDGERAVAAAEVQADAAVTRVARNLLRKMTTDWISGSELRKTLRSTDRDLFDDAIERLLRSDLIESAAVAHAGQNGAQYRLPGGAR